MQGPVRERLGWLGAAVARCQFEGAHCVTVVGRLLTLPMRPHLPDFYIAGFPVRTFSNTVFGLGWRARCSF